MNIQNRAGRLLIVTLAACVAGLAAPAWLRADVTVALTQTPALATVTNGLSVQVDAVVTTNAAEVVTGCNLVFRTLAEGTTNWWNTNAMSNVGAAAWRGFVPRLPEGTVEYYVDALFAGGPAQSATTNYTVSATLVNRRVTDFVGWTLDGGGTSTNYYRTVPGSDGSDSNRWYASGAFIGLPGGSAGTRPQYNGVNAASPHGYIRSIQDSYIRSPYLAEGAGTVYFISCKRTDDGITATIQVQYTTSATPDTGWQLVQTLSYSNTTQQSWPIIINRHDARYVRLVRTDATYGAPSSTLNGAVVFDNLAISIPPADVLLTPLLPVSPSEPVTQQVVTVSCDWSDVNAYVPTINRRLNVVYRWNSDAAVTNAMTNAFGNTFTAVIPGLGAGTNQYYFTSEFDGYFYKLDPDGSGVVTQRIERIGSQTSATNSYPIVDVVSRVPLFVPDPLAFGSVPISGWKTNALTVSNIGNATLTVTGIHSTEPVFSITPTNFTLAAFGSTNLTVTFAPSILGAYTGKLIFVSNQTAGTNQVEVTGLGEAVEEVSVPTGISGPAAGARTQSLSFTASGATNNYPARGVEYRFDWGVGDPETNLFGAATQAYAWQSLSNAFPIRAQARSQTDTSKVSAWSAVLATVAITNTRIINVSGSLAFGDVVINTTTSRTVTVSNTGSEALTVSDITCTAADVVIAPKNFTLAAFSGSSNVTVTFTPLSLGGYAGTLNVHANQTSGANTLPVSGTGVPVELVSVPTGISPPTAAGARTQSLSFTASGATNNYPARGVEYRFDWGVGDPETNVWGAAVQAYAWQTISNAFSIRAQARSQTDPSKVSAWSAVLATVAITNTRIVNVSGSLVFGDVVINTTTSRTVTVSNTGSEALTVSDITCTAADVVIAPKNFTLAAFSGSSNVTVTFSPLSLGGYAGTLTVHANQTSGANTLPMSATVIDVEVVNITSFSGPSNGATNELLTFSAVAVNNYAGFGHGVQYRFDWGDNRTSAWSSASSASTNWTVAGTYAVSVQARCNLDTNTVVTGWYTPINLTVRPAPVVTFTPVDNGLPTPVTVTVAGASACTLFYSPAGETVFDSVPLVAAGGNNWTGTIPSINAGLMRYYVRYTVSGPVDIVWPNAAPYPTYLINSVPGERRFTNFSGWIRDTNAPYSDSSTNYYRDVTGGGGTEPNRWYASGVFIGFPSGAVGVRPQFNSANAPSPHGYIRSIQGSYIRSPFLSEGVGTLYFISCMRSDYTATMEIQITTNATPDAGWQTVLTNHYSGTAQQAAPVPINRRDARYVRLLRTDETFGAPSNTLSATVVFDNISISIPPSDVTISERLHYPAYPARDQDVKVRCVVKEEDSNFPTVGHQVRVYYRWTNSALPFVSNVVMTAKGGGLYEGVIPAQEPGILYYYFRCDFGGYYFELDPDGTGGTQGTNSENRSAAFLPVEGVISPSGVLSYEVRRYQSIFSDVMVEGLAYLNNGMTNAVSELCDLTANHAWQGLALVKGMTNMTWHFMGNGVYPGDAAELTNTNWNYATTNWYLGDNDQDFPYPPIAGKWEMPATSDMRAEFEYDGFLVFQVNTDPAYRDYIVKRAVYQDFDAWLASLDYFEESLGLYEGAVQSFTNNFNAWLVDVYASADSQNLSMELMFASAGQPYVTTLADAPPNFAYVDGKVIAERAPLNNTAMALDPYSRGRIRNTSAGFTPGVEKFMFTARASVDDPYFALYQGTAMDSPFDGINWTSNYVVTVTMRATEISPAPAYISTLVYYQPAMLSLGSFYEVRLVQSADTALEMQVWRWNKETATPIRITAATGTANFTSPRLDTGKKAIEITVDKSTDPSKTMLFVRCDKDGGTNWGASVRFDDTDVSKRLKTGGSVGFKTFDAVPEISSLAVRTTNYVDMLPVPVLTNWTATTTWYMGGKYSDAVTDRWNVNSSGYLWRPLTTYNVGVYTASDKYDPRDPGFIAYTPRRQYAVTSLTPSVFTLSLYDWRRQYVELRANATNATETMNDLPVVVDNLILTPWRANTRSNPANGNMPGGVDYRDWTTLAEQTAWVDLQPGWAVLEGLVATSSDSQSNEVQFTVSRAATNLIQGLVSPVLTNGIGSIAFDYRAANTQVVFVVERSEEGFQQSFVVLEVVTSTVARTSFYKEIRTNFTGRIRVRVLPTSEPLTVLKIDNLRARDYPPRDETTWQAYNALITSKQAVRAWEATKAPPTQTAFLNWSVDGDTAPNVVLDEFQPFIQSPQVGTGIGEIGFWYRVWDSIHGLGNITLKVAPSRDTPEAQWTTITNFSFSNTEYQYFRMEPFDIRNTVLRIYGATTNNFNRVGIDNVLMTEPVRSGYEIRSVTLDPAQPLVNQSVDLVVEVGRFIKNPTNIEVFVSYHTNSAVWGYTNWWAPTDTADSVKIKLTNSLLEPRKYRTTVAARIPAFPVDTPVQFVAWGTLDGLVGAPIFQATNTFTNPSWYYPRDLNGPAGYPSNGYGAQGWSPYYFVFSCAPGAVWINEINYFPFFLDYSDYEYIELAGPAGKIIGDWRIESIDAYDQNSVLDSCTVTPGHQLPEDGDGWGFFVWGDPNTPNVDQTFAMPVEQNLRDGGGIRLVRSMGAWEQRLAYGQSGVYLIPAGYESAGWKDFLFDTPQVLGLIGQGSAYTNFYWASPIGPGVRTPGAKNVGQSMVPITAGFFTITQVVGPGGSADPDPLGGIQVTAGGTTSIVYTASQWFRIAALTNDTTAVPGAINARKYTNTFAGISADHNVQVTFKPATPAQAGIDNTVPTSWAANYYATEAAAAADTSLATDYLLNLNPTIEYVIGLTFSTITVNGAGITNAVVLKDGATNLTTTINGKLKMQGKTSLTNAAWMDVSGAALNNASFINGTNVLGFTDTTNQFFQAVITPL